MYFSTAYIFESLCILSTEMPGIMDSPELFLILVIHYKTLDDTGKIIGKTEFNESLSSAQ